jgi:hypothetical protein
VADRQIKSQVTIEFTIAFFCLLVFLLATVRIFVWFGNNIIQRHKAFEETRTKAGREGTTASQIDFYNQEDNPLDIFDDWVD